MVKEWIDTSLRLKFFSLGLVIVFLYTLISALIISHNEINQWNGFLHDKSYSLASYIADISQEDILDKNLLHLDNIVKKINNDPDIIGAVIYDKHGKLLTSLFAGLNLKNPEVKELVARSPAAEDLPGILSRIHQRLSGYTASVPVFMGQEPLGRVEIILSENKVRQGIQRMVNGLILGGVFSLFLAFVLLLWFQNIIIKPVLDLVALMTHVARTKDYSSTATICSRDELGLLAQGFNSMLAQIRSNRENLEAEVKERTSKLFETNQKMQQEIFERALAEENLRLSEEKYRVLFESSSDAIMTTDLQTFKFSDANQATLRMFKAKSKEEFLSFEPWAVSPLWQPDGNVSEDKARQMIALAVRDGGLLFEWVHKRLSGEEFPATVLLTRMSIDHKPFLQATVRDLTEVKKAEKELKSVQAQLLQSEKLASIGQLAAGVAHEINNPVGFISNNMELLGQYVSEYTRILRMFERLKHCVEEGDLAKAKLIVKDITEFENEIQLDYIISGADNLLRHNQRGIERIKKIVMDLRTFARDDKDTVEWVKVEEVIENILSIVHNELKYKAELKRDYGNTPQIRCNRQRLGQVFINLFINAAQAIETKGIIEVKTYQQEGYLCADIKDSGKGIPPENIGKIFDAFFTTKPAGQGTGLGLSVSYEIIKKYGGQIKVVSKMGEGTTFTVMLPLNEKGS